MSETKKSIDPLSDQRILSLPPADAVTSIRLVGTGIELELPRLAIALDDSLNRLRPMLEWCMGFDSHADIAALAKIAGGGPLCLIGRPGCDQAQLARAIHDTSPRRAGRFISINTLESRERERASLVAASRGTAFVDVRVIQRATSFLVTELFGDAYHVRAVIAAPDHKRIDGMLGPFASRLRAINLPSGFPRLLNSIFRRDLNSEREVEVQGDKNLEAPSLPVERQHRRSAACGPEAVGSSRDRKHLCGSSLLGDQAPVAARDLRHPGPVVRRAPWRPTLS